ncbi:hypothetical protein Lser_V15G06159 [Lactuca serriola]
MFGGSLSRKCWCDGRKGKEIQDFTSFIALKNTSSALHSFSFPLVSPPSPNSGLRHPLTCTVSITGFPAIPANFSIHAFASVNLCRFKGFQIEDLVGLFFAPLLLVRSEINMKELGNSWIEG